MSQLDFTLFANAATLFKGDQWHGAAGASVELQMQLGFLSPAVSYQFARRYRDDRANTHLVLLSLGL